jgi:MFS family permease
MGGATTAIGVVPTYASIGMAAPILLVLLRLVQGLALGGEYGGAAVYVAEHVPDNRRGFYTAFIQTTATLGLFLSLGVILAVRLSLPKEAFAAWGWRIPFLLSVLLVGLSVIIRLRMSESPIFAKLKAKGQTAEAPLKEAFASKRNWKIIATVLFGAARGRRSSGTRASSTPCSSCRASSKWTSSLPTSSWQLRSPSERRSSSSSAPSPTGSGARRS